MGYRFRAGVESWVQNRFECPPNLNNKDMHFLRLPCEKGKHFGDNCLDEVPITTMSEVRYWVVAMIYQHCKTCRVSGVTTGGSWLPKKLLAVPRGYPIF